MRNQFHIFIYCLLSAFSCFSQNTKVDSLVNFLKTAKEDTNTVNAMNKISSQYQGLQNYNAAIQYAQMAKSLSQKIFFRKGTMKSYNNLGIINWYLGNYPEGLKNYFESLKIAEEIDDKRGMANCYTNIGLIYTDQKNYSDALSYHDKALKIRDMINDKGGVAACYTNIGLVYNSMGNYDEALKNYFASLKTDEEIGEKWGMAIDYNNIAIANKKQSNYSEAIKNYFEAINIIEELGDKQTASTIYINVGILFIKLKDYKKSRDYINKGLQYSLETRNKNLIRSGYGGLRELEDSLRNYKAAFENYKLFVLYSDSLINDENTRKTVMTQMQYDFDKKQTADSIKNFEQIKQENFKHEHEIKEQKTYTYGGILGFMLMLIVAGVSFHAFRQKQKTNLVIAHQKELVEEKQKEILDSIHYAKRIQRSLLPTEKYIQKNLMRLKK